MRGLGLLFLAFTLWLSAADVSAGARQDAPAPVGAQAGAQRPAQPASKLAAISVTGSKRYKSEDLAAETGLKPGASVTRTDLQNAADALTQLGIFSNVGYRFSSAPAGVTVIYEVADGPALPVAFDNFPWVSDDDLRAAIKAAVPMFDGTGPTSGKYLDEMAAAMTHFLETKGIFVKISDTSMADPLTDEQTLQFLSAGAEEDVKSIDFSDALASSNPAIQERLADLVGKPYSLTAIKLFELEQVRPVYYAHGLLRMNFKTPTVQAPAPAQGSTAPNVAVHIEIDAGPEYNWGGVTWTGDSALSAADLNALVTLKPGDPTDGTKIQAIWNSVTDAYSHRGYLDATATPAPQYDDQAKRVNYTVTIVEGPQYKMGNLVLSGLSTEGERRIRMGWKIQPGSVFDETFFNTFIDSGAKDSFTGIPWAYNRVDHFLDKNPATATVNVLLDFK